MSIDKLKPKTLTYRDYQFFNINEFAFDANRINWGYIYQLQDIDNGVEFLSDAIVTLFDIHAPYRTITVRNPSKPYITDTIKEMIHLKDKAFSKFKRTGLDTDKQLYKDLKNYLSIAIRAEKKIYLENKINSIRNDSGKLWKEFQKWGIHTKNLNIIDSELCDANKINNYFVNAVPVRSVDADLLDYFNTNVHEAVSERFQFDLITEAELEEVLHGSKSNAFGADGINLKMLKIVFPYCKKQLTHLMNISLNMGCVPLRWKKAIVSPIAKVPKAVTLDSLRPVSILPTLAKLLEAIVFAQLSRHMDQIAVLPKHQSGFRSSYSTTTALLKLVSDFTCSIDQSRVTLLVLLDYTKAFDSIDHKLMISKLRYYGCSASVVQWFESYLNNRTQAVRINDTVSREMPLPMGVPQGSILGPLLFIIFSADLPNVVTSGCSYHLYADDAQLYVSTDPLNINSAATVVNENLALLSTWSKKNGLKLNPGKSVVMCVGSAVKRQRALSSLSSVVSCDGSPLEFVDCAKVLGLYLDCHLTFQTHVVKKTSLCYSRFRTLYQFKYSLSPSAKWCIVNSIQLCHIDYGLCVYFSHLSKEYKTKLQILQNSCLRFSYNLLKYDHITHHYNRLGILKLENRFTLLFCCIIYKILRSHIPQYLISLLVRRRDIHSRDLRYVNRYDIPKHHTAKFQSCFAYMAASVFNEYVEFFDINSFVAFKNKLKSLFISFQ